MSRLSTIPAEDWPAALRAATGAGGRSPLEQGIMRIAAHRPSIALGLVAFSRAMREDPLLDARLVELVRLRIAFHNQCRSCMAVRYADPASGADMEEALVCSLEKPQEAPGLTEAERAALDFADRFATNHLSIDDAVYANLKTVFSEAQIVELGFACARFVGIGRLAATWNMIEDLPAAYRDMDAVVAPWSTDPALHVAAARPDGPPPEPEE